jgi:sugar (pentulose or hexulose) kinase
LWLNFVSNVLGRDIHVPEMAEATGTGGLIAAGSGIDMWDWKGGVETLVRHRTITPNRDKASWYAEMFKRWKTGYEAVLDMREKL